MLAGMQAVMTFDLGCPVGDAAWAPYSATVFAAVGDDGCVQVSLHCTALLSLSDLHATADEEYLETCCRVANCSAYMPCDKPDLGCTLPAGL